MKKIANIILLLAAGVACSFVYDAVKTYRSSRFENRELKVAAAAPAFTPDPNVVAFLNAGNPFGQSAPQPWLIADTTDMSLPPGTSPATTFLVSRAEPIVTQDGGSWKITFKP
jgi:hypothetical protein